MEYYETQEKKTDDSGESNGFRYVISFLIPLVGFIMGGILLSKDSADERAVGQNCIIAGIVSVVIGIIAAVVYYNSLMELM